MNAHSSAKNVIPRPSHSSGEDSREHGDADQDSRRDPVDRARVNAAGL